MAMALTAWNAFSHALTNSAVVTENNVTLSDRTGNFGARRSIADSGGLRKSVVSFCETANACTPDKEDIAEIFKELKDRIVKAAKHRPDKQEFLDLCEDFRTGLSALSGLDLLREIRTGANPRFSRATSGLASPKIPQSPSLMVSLHQKLGSGTDRTHENYMMYVSTLKADIVVGGIQPVLHRYSMNEPATYYHFLELWVKMLEVLFPVCCGYEIVLGWRKVNGLHLAYGQVVKRSEGSAEGKVLLIILPRREARRSGSIAAWEGTIENYLCTLAQQLFDEQVTYYPDRIFWFGFRGVHFGCGWQFNGWYPDRFWPADPAPYCDVRNGTVVEALRCLIQLMCDSPAVSQDALLQRSGRMLRKLM